MEPLKDCTMMTAAVHLVSNLGFPVVVAAYLLLKLGPLLRQLLIAVEMLQKTMDHQADHG